MLQHHLTDGILTITPHGALTEADFKAVTAEVDPYIEKFGELKGVLIDAPAFPGWDSFAACVSHFRFVRDHHNKIAKVAVVTDNSFLTFAPQIAKHFAHADMRQFDAAKKDEAMAWPKA